ncbi:hypothetical protein C8F01DRAFT_1366549 [Mycena amicta]|nr:hypothetical protein C8F01DRAFT_1366549 [Mycena amicta]
MRFPNELLMQIFRFADHPTLNSVSLVSRTFRALSLDAHSHHWANLAWSSPRAAEKSLAVFWEKYPNKRGYVQSLSVRLRGHLGGAQPGAESIFPHIAAFKSLKCLVITSGDLPGDFYELLASLESLRELTVSSCIVPRKPDTVPRCAPHLHTVTLAHLFTPHTESHPVYFFSLFPHVTTLTTDRLDIDNSLKLTSKQTAQLTSLTLGGTSIPAAGTMQSYYTGLQRFDLPELRRLSFMFPAMYHYNNMRYSPINGPGPTTPKPLPSLEELFGPLPIVHKLLETTNKLTSVAVQNDITDTASALRLIIGLTAVFCRIAELFPGLVKLELLHYLGAPNDKFMHDVGATHLPRLVTPGLKVLHIYALPTAPSEVQGYFSSSNQTRPPRNAKPPLPFAKLRRFVEAWGEAAPTLKRVKLGREEWNTWVRDDNFDWEQRVGDEISTTGWSSVRRLDDHLTDLSY